MESKIDIKLIRDAVRANFAVKENEMHQGHFLVDEKFTGYKTAQYKKEVDQKEDSGEDNPYIADAMMLILYASEFEADNSLMHKVISDLGFQKSYYRELQQSIKNYDPVRLQVKKKLCENYIAFERGDFSSVKIK